MATDAKDAGVLIERKVHHFIVYVISTLIPRYRRISAMLSP